MVLQRNKPIRFFGSAPKNAEVRVTFAGESRAVPSDGRWSAEFPAMDAGGPHELTVSAGDSRLTVTDILVGEVWVAAGQSNMELPLDRTSPWPGEALAETRPADIREFSAPVNPEFHHPKADMPKGRWRRADGPEIGTFSALGYRFASLIRERLNVPVGIRLIAIGGSPVEAWVDRETLSRFPEFAQGFSNARNDSWRSHTAEEDQRRIARWYDALNRADPGLDSDAGVTERLEWHGELWAPCSIPEGRGDGTLGDGPGSVWVRRFFHATPAQARAAARLRLGTLVDSDRAWINGIEVGSTGYRYPPRRYAVPEGVIREGKNELMVRIVSEEGPARFIPGKRYDLSWEGENTLPRIELGGPCEFKRGAAMEPLAGKTFMEWLPTGLYNSRTAPMSLLPIRGVIWYQGESNTGNPAGYGPLFRAAIECWRRAWGDDNLPFLYTQLANYRDPVFLNRANGWPAIREAQRECRSVPGTGMTSAVDLGEWNDLHPANKKELARRFALLARKIAYGEADLEAEGPHPVAVTKAADGKIRVELIQARGLSGGRIAGFEIGDEAGAWRPATGITAGDAGDGNATVEIETAAREGDRMLRYAWADDPTVAFPLNGAGLPLAPFLEKIGFSEKY